MPKKKEADAVDPLVVEAVKSVVRERGQSAAVARHLTAWFRSLALGEVEITDRGESERHFSSVSKALTTEETE